MTDNKNIAPLRRQILEVILSKGRPMSMAELEHSLGSPNDLANESEQALVGLCKAGLLVRLRGDRIGVAKEMDLVLGRVEVHSNGFGFLLPDDGSEDLYLSPRQLRRAMPDDRVLGRVRRIDRQGRKEAAIVEVLNSVNRTVLGRFETDSAVNVIRPQDKRIAHMIHVAPGDESGATHGQVVVGEIIVHPGNSTYVQARVTEILSQDKPAALATESAIRRRQLPREWPCAIAGELERISREPGCEKDLTCKDLTNEPFITIDGADARDFDDAVHCASDGDDFLLDVAIADVSRFVRSDSALDQVARERGNSAYFPDRVIPMLPELLSNDLCSLRPGRMRWVFACQIRVRSSGEIAEYKFSQARIRSAARLTYEDASAFLRDPKGDGPSISTAVQENLKMLDKVATALGAHRRGRGGVEFEFPQALISYDPNGTIASIKNAPRSSATGLIEECMLAANVCAARALDSHLPEAIYRIHETPDRDAVADLRRVLGFFGVKLPGRGVPPALDFSAALAAAREKGAPVAALQMLMLRTMKQARYASCAQPHFALGFERYTHFTSPIRRYPDLIVHRLLKGILGLGSSAEPTGGPGELGEVADHCSVTDRRAEEASREVTGWLKAEFMSRHIGETFTGRVSGVTAFGVFVTLDLFQVDGLVHISELGNDYFHFDPSLMLLVAEHSGRRISLGDVMTVRVTGARPDEAKIDFVPLEPVGGENKARWKRRTTKKR